MLVAHIHGSIRGELKTAPIVFRKDWRSALGTVIIDLLRRAARGSTPGPQRAVLVPLSAVAVYSMYTAVYGWLYRMHTEPHTCPHTDGHVRHAPSGYTYLELYGDSGPGLSTTRSVVQLWCPWVVIG